MRRYRTRNPEPEYKRAWKERQRRAAGIQPRPRADTICPLCASPKHRQSLTCAACYYELRRIAGTYSTFDRTQAEATRASRTRQPMKGKGSFRVA